MATRWRHNGGSTRQLSVGCPCYPAGCTLIRRQLHFMFTSQQPLNDAVHVQLVGCGRHRLLQLTSFGCLPPPPSTSIETGDRGSIEHRGWGQRSIVCGGAARSSVRGRPHQHPVPDLDSRSMRSHGHALYMQRANAERAGSCGLGASDWGVIHA